MSVNNGASLKVIEKQLREFSELHAKYKDVNLKYMEMLEVFPDLKILCGNLKKENKQLRKMLKKWTDENTMLQESLDGAQREIGILNDKIESLYDCGDDLRNFHLVEGEDV